MAVKADRILVSELQAILDKARSDAAVFAALTIFLTPFVVVAIVVAFLFALAFVDLPVIDHLGYAVSVVTGVNLAVGFMVASYFLDPKPSWQHTKDDTFWVTVALILYCGLLILSYGTSLVKTHPAIYWPGYLAMASLMFGCIGHAYEPRDDYYLGWMMGPVVVDDPFTFRDDIDRAHVSLGFVAALSHLALDSYASVFGSSWLWRGLRDAEVSEAVALLQAIATNDTAHAKARMRGLCRPSAAHVVRALTKLELITIDRGSVRLTEKGRQFLGER